MPRRKTVLTSGAFDVIHPGHLKMLEEAKRRGGQGARLVVVLARDETIRESKGREPIFDEKARHYLVSMLKPVDEVILGYRPFSFEKIIKKVKPDIVVFGYDQHELMEEFKKFCREKGLKIRVYRARHYKIGRLNSTSDVIERVREILGERG